MKLEIAGWIQEMKRGKDVRDSTGQSINRNAENEVAGGIPAVLVLEHPCHARSWSLAHNAHFAFILSCVAFGVLAGVMPPFHFPGKGF